MNRTNNNLFALILILLLFATSFCTVPQEQGDLSQDYMITKIDSIGNYYSVYAMRNDSIFQIASKKSSVKNCNLLQVNGRYQLSLRSMLFVGEKDGINITRATNDLVKCVGVDETTSICFDDDSVQDLFYTDNLNGLCYIENE